jgi:hypothetical protein
MELTLQELLATLSLLSVDVPKGAARHWTTHEIDEASEWACRTAMGEEVLLPEFLKDFRVAC